MASISTDTKNLSTSGSQIGGNTAQLLNTNAPSRRRRSKTNLQIPKLQSSLTHLDAPSTTLDDSQTELVENCQECEGQRERLADREENELVEQARQEAFAKLSSKPQMFPMYAEKLVMLMVGDKYLHVGQGASPIIRYLLYLYVKST